MGHELFDYILFFILNYFKHIDEYNDNYTYLKTLVDF